MDEEEEPPVNKTMTFLMLPDDLVINCLARVSRLYYPILSLVSKRFRSFLASTELYQTRTFLGRTEICLYVCLQVPNGLSYPLRWFILCQRPNSSKKILVPISSPDSPSTYGSSAAAVSSNIYAIGGYINRNASSSVMVMDCGSHTWREAPNMRVAREHPSACVVDGKIYVAGGCQNPNSTNWMEVFDTKTQTWEFLQIPSEEICKGSRYQSVGYEGTVYLNSVEKRTTYKLHRGRWREADLCLDRGWYGSSFACACVVENVLYACGGEVIRWYDPSERSWRALKGLLRSFESFDKPNVQLVDYGGKIAVFWEEYKRVNDHRERFIWCAEIALEVRDQEKEIWGTLEWSDVVLVTSEFNTLMQALATTL